MLLGGGDEGGAGGEDSEKKTRYNKILFEVLSRPPLLALSALGAAPPPSTQAEAQC